MFLMQLSKNIHDGHGPGVLGPKDLQYQMHKYIREISMRTPEEPQMTESLSIEYESMTLNWAVV